MLASYIRRLVFSGFRDWELLHVDAHLGKDAGRGFLLDAPDALQQKECLIK